MIKVGDLKLATLLKKTPPKVLPANLVNISGKSRFLLTPKSTHRRWNEIPAGSMLEVERQTY